MARKRLAGFSLIEMLIVMGITGILAGLLIPVLSQARATARDTKCVSNLKGIGTALMLYVQRNDDFLPACGPDGTDPDMGDAYDAWYRALLPYVQNWAAYSCPSKNPSVLDIPDVESAPGETPSADAKYHEVHYGMNFQFLGLDPDFDLMGGTVQVDNIASPSRILFIADGGTFKNKDMNPNEEAPDSIIDGALHFPDDSGDIPTGKATISPRHNGNTIVLFLDGHVERLNTKEVLSKKRDDSDCIYVGAMMQ
ncbi:MAG TPA: prepilin-type N-terminal cleavage/methylation domain-containing protein [Planctomycetota bacterium]|nr:prepilin-type N-terminal cleavage/methylation domain-containing protein [Planctomycetota bacterium]